MKDKIKIGLLVIVLGTLWGGYDFYSFVTLDQVKMEKDVQNRQASVETVKNELNRLTSFAEGISEVKAKLKKTNAEFEEALEFIPRTIDLSKLLAKINVLARNSGVEIESFRPLKESGAPAAVQSDNKSFFDVLPIDIRLRGGFAQTLMFFDQVARLKRIINIDTLKMVTQPGAENRSLATPVTLVETTLALKTYRFSE